MTNVSTLTFDQWEEKYQPQLNHFENDENGNWNGLMYETFGEDADFIHDLNNTDPKRVWTILEDDNGNGFISNGYNFINRMGYIVTALPWEEGDDLTVDPDYPDQG